MQKSNETLIASCSDTPDCGIYVNMGKHNLLLAAALTMTTQLHGQADPNCPVQPATFKAMRDCFRPVLVFAPTAKDPSFVAQHAMLEQYADEMTDRNLLYVPVLEQPKQFQKPLDAPFVMLNHAELNSLRTRFQVDPAGFTIILVGKDGGEKFRSRKPVSVLKLDTLVDSMPMGQQEKSARQRKSQ